MSSWLQSRTLYTTIAALVVLIGYGYQALRFRTASSQVILFDRQKNITYVGAESSGIERFQNIFYAQDTSGAQRFAPPVPFTPSPGTVIDATSIGAACPQGMGPAALPFTSPVTNVSENCLSLGITRPAGLDATANLPVMVWLHGGWLSRMRVRRFPELLICFQGGFTLGTGSDQLYQPDGLVRQSMANGQSVIVVNINYRIASMKVLARLNYLCLPHQSSDLL